jgi:hypothetical protein
MKKIIYLIVLCLILQSCTKESSNQKIIAVICNDGSMIPGSNQGACGFYTLTTNGVSVTLSHGGFNKYVYGNKGFCELYGNSTYCLGKGY